MMVQDAESFVGSKDECRVEDDDDTIAPTWNESQHPHSDATSSDEKSSEVSSSPFGSDNIAIRDKSAHKSEEGERTNAQNLDFVNDISSSPSDRPELCNIVENSATKSFEEEHDQSSADIVKEIIDSIVNSGKDDLDIEDHERNTSKVVTSEQETTSNVDRLKSEIVEVVPSILCKEIIEDCILSAVSEEEGQFDGSTPLEASLTQLDIKSPKLDFPSTQLGTNLVVLPTKNTPLDFRSVDEPQQSEEDELKSLEWFENNDPVGPKDLGRVEASADEDLLHVSTGLLSSEDEEQDDVPAVNVWTGQIQEGLPSEYDQKDRHSSNVPYFPSSEMTSFSITEFGSLDPHLSLGEVLVDKLLSKSEGEVTHDLSQPVDTRDISPLSSLNYLQQPQAEANLRGAEQVRLKDPKQEHQHSPVLRGSRLPEYSSDSESSLRSSLAASSSRDQLLSALSEGEWRASPRQLQRLANMATSFRIVR